MPDLNQEESFDLVETDEEDDEGFLKRDTSFVDVETCFHLLRWCADTCHAASYELDDEADYVEEDEDGCEGAGFEVEEAVAELMLLLLIILLLLLVLLENKELKL